MVVERLRVDGPVVRLPLARRFDLVFFLASDLAAAFGLDLGLDVLFLSCAILIAAWAAASRATGTRKGLHDT